MSGKMLKSLKWPSVKQWAFLLACGIVTFGLAVNERTRLENFLEGNSLERGYAGAIFSILSDFLYVYLLVVFIGLILFGSYDKLWLPALIALIDLILSIIIFKLSNSWTSGFDLFEIGIVFTVAIFILLIYDAPRRYASRKSQLESEEPITGVESPGYKLVNYLKVAWPFFWGFVFLFNLARLVIILQGTGWPNLYETWFTFQENYEFINFRFVETVLAFDVFPRLLWIIVATCGVLDTFKEDARYFYFGVGVFSLWQIVRLIVFYSELHPIEENTGQNALILLLIGGSLLLRAAWNRPPPEAGLSS